MDLESLYLSNQNLVYSCLQRYFGKSVVWDEDVVQSGFMGLWKALQRYQEQKGTLGQWAWFWIRKEVQRELKGQKEVVMDVDERVEGVGDKGKCVEEIVYEREVRDVLCEFLDSFLTELEKEVLVRKIMYDESFLCIARKVGLKMGEVRVVFENALAVVRDKKDVLKRMLGEVVE